MKLTSHLHRWCPLLASPVQKIHLVDANSVPLMPAPSFDTLQGQGHECFAAAKTSGHGLSKAELKEPDAPVFIHQEVESEELKAVWEREECQLMANGLNAFTCQKIGDKCENLCPSKGYSQS